MFIGRVNPGTRIASEVGWGALAGYLTIALLCAWLALHCQAAEKADERRGWWLLCVFMAGLGINKQLNLQTLLLEAGRTLAKWGHWYSYRRYVQLSFVLVLMLITAVVAWKTAQYYWPILEQRLELAAGFILVTAYCILRAAEIDHVKPVTVQTRFAHSPFWLVEIAGILLALIGTIRAVVTQRLPRGAMQ
jgi:hypothetical protein